MDTTTANVTESEAAVLAIWRTLGTTAQHRVMGEARRLARPDAQRTSADLFAEWLECESATEPADPAAYDPTNDRMREIVACLCARPMETPADLARAILADTYHGSFAPDDGNGLLSRCYALAGASMPGWRIDN